MGVHKHREGQWRLRVSLRPGVRISWAFDRKADASDYETTLRAIRKARRDDLIDFIAGEPEQLHVLHAAVQRSGVAGVRLTDLFPAPEVPTIGVIAREFFEYMQQDGARSRFKRPFAKTTASAYRAHIERFMEWLELGERASVTSISEGTLASYHMHRVNAKEASAVGADRSITPIQAMLSWASDPRRRQAGAVPNLRPLRFSKSKATKGAPKALTPSELRAIKVEIEPDIWPVFETTLELGLRITECLFLRADFA